jgi:hypothetical protein
LLREYFRKSRRFEAKHEPNPFKTWIVALLKRALHNARAAAQNQQLFAEEGAYISGGGYGFDGEDE